MIRKISFPVLAVGGLFFILLCGFAPFPQNEQSEATTSETAPEEDSTVSVIAWFCKGDTMTYWIHDGQWKVTGGDTIQTLGIHTKVMLTVTDSTSKGYALEYRFLEFDFDPIEGSETQNIVNLVASQLQKDIVGTVIRFRTDEVGQITKYENLKEVKKQAKDLFSHFVQQMPYIDSLAAAGIKIEPLLKKIGSSDLLIDGYVEELQMLFQCHGNQYPIGEFTEHQDATETEYACDTYMAVGMDPETYEYDLRIDVDNYIPKEDLKSLVGNLADLLLDKDAAQEAKKELATEFDQQVQGDAVYSSYLYAKYFPDGWPEDIVYQEKTLLEGQGKLTQKYITWDYRSVGNF